MLKKLYDSADFLRRTPYRIEEVNLRNDQVTIQCRGINAIVKLSLTEIICDTTIIDGLPSIQACWLGYHYIKSRPKYDTAISNKEKSPQIQFALRYGDDDRYKIVSFLYRSSELTYFDFKQNRVVKGKITKISQNTFFLNNIHPSQAFYVGMLVGHEVVKHGIEVLVNQTDFPFLTLVK